MATMKKFGLLVSACVSLTMLVFPATVTGEDVTEEGSPGEHALTSQVAQNHHLDSIDLDKRYQKSMFFGTRGKINRIYLIPLLR